MKAVIMMAAERVQPIAANFLVTSSLIFRRSSVGPWINLQGIIFLVQAAAYLSLSAALVKVKWPPKWVGEKM